MFPEGNSVNFAVYGKQIGYETVYLGVLGDDKEAEIILEALRTKEADISKCVMVGMSKVYGRIKATCRLRTGYKKHSITSSLSSICCIV